MKLDLKKLGHFGLDNISTSTDLTKISPDVFMSEITDNTQKYVVILADYFDDNDINSVFPDAIRKLYGYDIKYLPSDYENDGDSDLARNLAYPNDKYSWIFVVTQK